MIERNKRSRLSKCCTWLFCFGLIGGCYWMFFISALASFRVMIEYDILLPEWLGVWAVLGLFFSGVLILPIADILYNWWVD